MRSIRLGALVTLVAALGAEPIADFKPSAASVEGQVPKARPTNRLAQEKSPYLQLHAHNPVDWYPWGDAAFAKARRERKLIFLSIGYATCHWCHVMEAESFSNVPVAALMNRSFVSIKVDREERPDIDRIYMSYVMSATGGGSWPLSVFLTPDLEPFLGGGYYPREDEADGTVGFKTVLQRVAGDWRRSPGKILEAAKNGTAIIEPDAGRRRTPGAVSGVGPDALDRTYRDIVSRYDALEGGFGRAEKFPRPSVINFLLREHRRTGSKEALTMALQTLDAMVRGGIHDQLNGGFHRYTSDRAWRVPHFEKMLYDQAQLAVAYAEAFQITRGQTYAAAARDTLAYVLRSLRAPEGGFYAAEDADSPLARGNAGLAEGGFYVWTADEIRSALNAESSPVVAFRFGVDSTAPSVLYQAHTLSETAVRFGRGEPEVAALLETAVQQLRTARAGRPRPSRDDQILVSWNGMMISALARGSMALDEPAYFDAARAAASFVEARMYNRASNSLKRRYRQGDARVDGLVEDYACLVQGLLNLYEASFEVKWLSWALRLQERQDALFWDAVGGGYFSTPPRASNVLLRMKDDADGAEPSANSVAVMNLLRLGEITDRRDLRGRADATFRAMSVRMARTPGAVPQLGVAVNFRLSKPKQIVVAGEPGAADTRAMLRLVHERFIPNRILLLADDGPRQAQISRWLPFVGAMTRRDNRATIYVCENYACRLPTNDLQVAARLLD